MSNAPNRQRSTIIIVVVVLLVLCCCCAAIGAGVWLWNNGDQLMQQMGITGQMLPLTLLAL